MAQSDIFSQTCNAYSAVATTVAHDYTQTSLNSSEHLDTGTFAKIPKVGEYLLSKCEQFAYRVLRHQAAKACGQNLTVIFVADPTPVSTENPFGDNGIEVLVHNRKCTSHCISKYYLTQPKSYGINATLI